MAAVFLTPLYILINVYVVFRMFQWMGAFHRFFRSVLFRASFAGIYVLLATTLLTGFLIKKPVLLHRILKNIANYFLGMFAYILLVILIFDLGRLLAKYIFHAPFLHQRSALVIAGSFCFFLILAVSVYGILHAKQLKITPYEVTVNKSVEGMDSLRIVLIADTHFGYSAGAGHAERLADAVNSQNPDIVLIAGDIFDNEYDAIRSPEKIAAALKTIRSRYGIYACWGNHDLDEPVLAGFTFGDAGASMDSRMEELLKDAGIRLLNDESLLIDDSFYIVGRKDPSRSAKTGETRLSPASLTSGLDHSRPIIFLDHQPKELSEIADAGADLDLCGHTHDGQLFPGNLFIHLFWENSHGYLRKGNLHNIVTSGAGVWGPNMRVGTDSEICTITVKFTGS